MGQRNNSSKYVEAFGSRPTDAEVREALAQGLPNPRWARQNKLARARAKVREQEYAIIVAQSESAKAAREFKPTEDTPEANNVDGLDRDALGESVD